MPSPNTIRFLRALSRLFGWIYTLSWSASFYPQPALNLHRHSTTGTSLSYNLLNLLGFTFYTLSTTLLYSAPSIRAQYAARNPASPTPTVRLNDVVFGAHAWLLCALTASMFVGRWWGFAQGGGRRVGRGSAGVMVGCVVGVGVVGGRVLVGGRGWEGIDVVYALGYAKLVITFCKYIPQAWMNYQRKSTVGWSIGPMLLDLTGGVLSVSQLVIDSSLQADWSGITGNPVKFGLGNVSVCFDLCFVVQHYWLYRGREGDEERGLLEEERGEL